MAPPDAVTLSGLVLAAGFSRRMGRPKALLPCGPSGETFAARAVRLLRAGGLADVVVVVRADDAPIRGVLGRIDPAPRLVVNLVPHEGQLSSLLAGIDDAEARGAEGVVVVPVDMPEVRPQSVAAVLAAARATPWPIVRVVYRGRHGHPVLFRRSVFQALRAADPRVGARAVVRSGAYGVLEVPVDDPGVVRDVDDPAAYEELCARRAADAAGGAFSDPA